MKFLKKTFLVLLILFLLFVIVSLFLPSEISIEKEKNIKAEKSAVFGLVNDLKKWKYWNPQAKHDTLLKVKFFGPPTGTNSGYEWTSEKNGAEKGKVTIKNSLATDSILVNIFAEGHGNAQASFYFRQQDSVVNVRWKMKRKIGFFGRIFPGLLMNSRMGKHFEKGLSSLDSLSHTAIAGPVEGIESVGPFERKNILCILDSCPERDLSFKIAKLYGELGRSFDQSETKMASAPMCIYHSVSTDNVVFEAAICVNKIPSSITNKKITVINISYKKVIVYNYFGSYSEIRNGYAKIHDYMTQHNLEQAGNSVEEYVSDPMAETNPDKWLTKIYVPVK